MIKLSEDYIDDILVRMAHHNSSIEGNTITLPETVSIILEGKSLEERKEQKKLYYKVIMTNIRKYWVDDLKMGLMYFMLTKESNVEIEPSFHETIDGYMLMDKEDIYSLIKHALNENIYDKCLYIIHCDQIESITHIHFLSPE